MPEIAKGKLTHVRRQSTNKHEWSESLVYTQCIVHPSRLKVQQTLRPLEYRTLPLPALARSRNTRIEPHQL